MAPAAACDLLSRHATQAVSRPAMPMYGHGPHPQATWTWAPCATSQAGVRVPDHHIRHGRHVMCVIRAAPQDDLGLADGWGLDVSPAPVKDGPKKQQSSSNPAGAESDWLDAKAGTRGTSTLSGKAPAKKAKPQAAGGPGTKQQADAAASKGKARSRSPFMDMTSEQGMLGLTLLQQKLKLAEQGRGGLTQADTQELINGLPQIAHKTAAKKLAVVPKAVKPRQRIVYEDDDGNTWEEEEDEDVTDKPSFELNVIDDSVEYVEYDKKGNIASRVATSANDPAGPITEDDLEDDIEDDDEDDDDFDFTDAGSGWSQLSAATAAAAAADLASRQQSAAGVKTGGKAAAAGPKSAGRASDAREVEQMLGLEGEDASSLMDGDELEDWGLDELEPRIGHKGQGGQPRRRTLMQELGVSRGEGSRPRGVDEDLGVTVTWGGTAGTSATDLDEQERLLARMFKPHKAAKLMAHQRAALAEAEALRRGGSARTGPESKLHRQLRIVAGSAANKKLLSSQGSQTRPMMEKVRQAIFNMIQSQVGTVSFLPAEARWLDLFAGTGSVGLEALSRGCRECHFVEMDPWVTRNVLGKNITTCNFQRQSIVHTNKAEEFLRKAVELPRFAGGAFDFISMCPPYLLVSYPELFSLLNASQLLHEGTILFVEYPKQLEREVPATVGKLVQVRNRKYGRTWIAVYGPPNTPAEEDIEDDDY